MQDQYYLRRKDSYRRAKGDHEPHFWVRGQPRKLAQTNSYRLGNRLLVEPYLAIALRDKKGEDMLP